MTVRTIAQGRGRQQQAGERRFARPRRAAAEPGFRAVTLGSGHDEWGVVDPDGQVVYRGYMLYAARLASKLTAELQR